MEHRCLRCTGHTRVSISCHLLCWSLERMSHWAGTLHRFLRAPLRMPLPLSYPFVVFELNFGGKYEIGFVGGRVDCFRSQQRNPHKMLRSCHKTVGGVGVGPLWLGMKGQMMPVLMFVQHACIFICIYIFFFGAYFCLSGNLHIHSTQTSPPTTSSVVS